jgi:hypothetical protein
VHALPSCSPAAAARASAAIVRERGFAGVDAVLCGDLNRDGRPDMAVSYASGGSAGDTGWAIFVAAGRSWRLSFKQLEAYRAGIFLRRGDVVESQPIYLKNDPNCCPTGGFDHRRFHWNGRRFAVARAWHDRAYKPPA